MTDILTIQPCFNPFFIEDRQLKKIVFYNDSGVVFETRSGWFGNNNNFRNGFNIPDATLRRKVEEMEKKLEELHIKINSYDLTLLMKKFDLVEKK